MRSIEPCASERFPSEIHVEDQVQLADAGPWARVDRKVVQSNRRFALFALDNGALFDVHPRSRVLSRSPLQQDQYATLTAATAGSTHV